MSIEVMNAVWRHSASTGRARLVLLAIADHQGEMGAWPSVATLARMVNASERSVQRDITFLAELGELLIEQQAAPTRGQYKSNLYWVQLPGVTNEVPGVTNEASGVTNEAARGDAVVALNLNKPLKNPNKNNVQDKLEPSFNEFWKIYPRRTGRRGALGAFAKAVTRANVDRILEGARRFANDPNLPPKQFIALPATWLNQDRWEDDPLPERELTLEEKQQREREKAEAKRLAALEQARLDREEQERLRRNLELNPPKRCEHDRIIYACKTCSALVL